MPSDTMLNTAAQVYLKHLPAITASMDAQDCAFYFNNSLFLFSKLANSTEWYTETCPGALIIHASNDWCTVLPTTTDRDEFTDAIRYALTYGKPLLRVPSWVVKSNDIFFEHDVQRMWPDYICDTEQMRTMAGSHRKAIRQRLRKLDNPDIQVVRLAKEHEKDAGELARLWYQRRESHLGTMYLFEENVWLFENWSTVLEHIEHAFGVAVLHKGNLVAANLSCPLSESYWCCHTERYNPDAPVYSNQLAFREAWNLAEGPFRPYINDGPAAVEYTPGVNNLATFKVRLSCFEIQPYQLIKQRPVSY